MIGLAGVAVGGGGDEAAGMCRFLPGRQHGSERVRRRGQQLADRGEISLLGPLMTDHIEDDAGDQCLGLFVPGRFAGLTKRIVNQGVGQKRGGLGQVRAAFVEGVESRKPRRERGRRQGQTARAAWIEMRAFSTLVSMHATERSAVRRWGMIGRTPLPERVGAMMGPA